MVCIRIGFLVFKNVIDLRLVQLVPVGVELQLVLRSFQGEHPEPVQLGDVFVRSLAGSQLREAL